MKDSDPAIHYLELVTDDVSAACDLQTSACGWSFSDPVPELGNARVAALPGGTLFGIRAPLSEQEKPVVRSYLRVPDLDAAVKRAEESGAMIALPSMEIPGRGRIAVFIHGGVEQGLWEAS